MTEERVEQIAEAKIHLAMDRLSRINSMGLRLNEVRRDATVAFGTGLTTVKEKAIETWFSFKKLFTKSNVVGHVPNPATDSNQSTVSIDPEVLAIHDLDKDTKDRANSAFDFTG